jgi:hypothetical protein
MPVSARATDTLLHSVAWVHFRLCALVLVAWLSWAVNLIVFATYGINWQLIFGDEIDGAAEVSAAAVMRACGAAFLWLCFCVASFVRNLDVPDAALPERIDAFSLGALYWPTLASGFLVGAPLLLLLLPLPILAWRTRLAWIKLLCKMAAVPFVEVATLRLLVFARILG